MIRKAWLILIVLFLISGCSKKPQKVMYPDEEPEPKVTVVVTATPEPVPSPTQDPVPVATEEPKVDPNCAEYQVDAIGGCDGTGLCGTTGKLDGKWASKEVRRPVLAIYHCFKEDK